MEQLNKLFYYYNLYREISNSHTVKKSVTISWSRTMLGRTPRLFKNFTVIGHVAPNYEFEEPCIESLQMTPLELLCKDYHGIFRWFWDFPKFNFRLVLKPRWFLFCSFEDSLFPFESSGHSIHSRVKTDEIRDERTKEHHVIKHEISKWPWILFEISENFPTVKAAKDTYPRRKGMKEESRNCFRVRKNVFCSNHF